MPRPRRHPASSTSRKPRPSRAVRADSPMPPGASSASACSTRSPARPSPCPRASTETVTVAYATANGTATAGSDYQAASGTLTFAAGETSKTITVLVNGDRLAESNETFFVNLSGPTNAIIADGQGDRHHPGRRAEDLHQRRDGHGRQHRHAERDLHREPVGRLRRAGDGPSIATAERHAPRPAATTRPRRGR